MDLLTYIAYIVPIHVLLKHILNQTVEGATFTISHLVVWFPNPLLWHQFYKRPGLIWRKAGWQSRHHSLILTMGIPIPGRSIYWAGHGWRKNWWRSKNVVSYFSTWCNRLKTVLVANISDWHWMCMIRNDIYNLQPLDYSPYAGTPIV